VDLFGHRYNMVNPEVRDALSLQDRVLGQLVETLNRRVGAHRWMLVLTADHGQTPTGEVTGGWPIDPSETEEDIAEHFGVTEDEILETARAGAFWLDRTTLQRHGLQPDDVARFLLHYEVKDNPGDAEDLPDGYRLRPGRRLFQAAFPTSWIDGLLDCARDRRFGG
jgi:predicted AlkP superfamily pyrophosphatase or phosphodiesterase